MVSAIDENYRGCHSYELALLAKKRRRFGGKKLGKERNTVLEKRQIEMDKNEKYERRRRDN